MKPFVYIFSTSLAICAIGGCSPRSGDSSDTAAQAGETPAASLTAKEAAAFAGYSSDMSASESAAGEASSVSIFSRGVQSQ